MQKEVHNARAESKSNCYGAKIAARILLEVPTTGHYSDHWWPLFSLWLRRKKSRDQTRLSLRRFRFSVLINMLEYFNGIKANDLDRTFCRLYYRQFFASDLGWQWALYVRSFAGRSRWNFGHLGWTETKSILKLTKFPEKYLYPVGHFVKWAPPKYFSGWFL